MTVSWDLIRSFEAVAETGSLSGASRKLGLTQPTIGRHVDLLEEALGLQLFTRSREGMRPTESGADLVGSAKEMLTSALAFERRALGKDRSIDGLVRISANEIFGILILPGLLSDIMDDHPGLEIELVVSNAASNLSQRDADIAVRMFRPKQNDLIARKVRDLPMGLFAHSDYLAKHNAPRDLADLRRHSLIGFDRDQAIIEFLASKGEVFSTGDFRFRSESILAHTEAIRAGIGIGPAQTGLAALWPSVERVLPDLVVPDLPLWLACHAEVRFNARIRLVMDLLAERLREPYRHLAPL